MLTAFEAMIKTKEVIQCIEKVKDVFLKMREMTKEENKAYKKSLKNIFKPTGKNFFDL